VPLFILALPLIIVLIVIVLTPLTLFQRYRVGTARRKARRWVVTLNVLGLSLSSVLFFTGAALTAIWVPEAFTYALAGFTGGCLLGVIGLSLSRWEIGHGSLHYTPNRWLVLGITVIVTARLAFGLVRTWRAWHTTTDYTSWAAASGAAGSLAAGAVVLGYYVTYWLGVRRRLQRHGA
jgi:hypothetical protein